MSDGAGGQSAGDGKRLMLDRDSRRDPLRLFIVSAVRIYREGLACGFARQEHVAVVGTSGADGAPRGVSQTRPDVVLIDGAMPGSAELPRLLAA